MAVKNLRPSSRAIPYWQCRHVIPGVFEDIDFLLFDHLLGKQAELAMPGDLLEIGAFLGKSAIVLGLHASTDRVLVCDIFEDKGTDQANTQENQASYKGLTRAAFEANYRAFVGTDPKVIQELSVSIREHVSDGTIRFAHIDGGHLYDLVRIDLMNVRQLVSDSGIVVFDDFRAPHTPGVAAAVWEAVANQGLVPVCLTDAKFYGTWGGEALATGLQADLHDWLSHRPQIRSGVQTIAGHKVTIVANPRIWTKRRAIKAAMPPLVAEKLLRRPVAFLGG